MATYPAPLRPELAAVLSFVRARPANRSRAHARPVGVLAELAELRRR